MHLYEKILSRFFIVFCLVGFLYQSSGLIQYYLAYGTLTSVMMELPSTFNCPDLSVCWRYSDIFDAELFNRDAERDVIDTKLDSLQQFQQMQLAVTIADIIKYTPDPNVTFLKCRLRMFNSYEFQELSDQNCNQLFDVRNFYLQQFICYIYSLKGKQ